MQVIDLDYIKLLLLVGADAKISVIKQVNIFYLDKLDYINKLQFI